MTDDKSSALIEKLNGEHRVASQAAMKYGEMAREARRKLPGCPTFAEEHRIRLDIATAEYRVAVAMVELDAIQSLMTVAYAEAAEANK